MIITKTCNTCEHFPNDKHCIGCEWDKSKGENSKWELKNNPIVIERKVLDKIRDEIEKIEGFEYEVSDNQGNRYKYETIEKGEALQIIDKYKGE